MGGDPQNRFAARLFLVAHSRHRYMEQALQAMPHVPGGPAQKHGRPVLTIGCRSVMRVQPRSSMAPTYTDDMDDKAVVGDVRSSPSSCLSPSPRVDMSRTRPMLHRHHQLCCCNSRVSRRQWPPPGADSPSPLRGDGCEPMTSCGQRAVVARGWLGILPHIQLNPTGPWSGVGRLTTILSLLHQSSITNSRTDQDAGAGSRRGLCLGVLACISWPAVPRFRHVLSTLAMHVYFSAMFCTNNAEATV